MKKDPSIATKYAFPKHKLKPLMYYWEEKCQTFLLKIIDAKPFQKEWFGMLSLGLGNKLQDLITYYDVLRALVLRLLRWNIAVDNLALLYRFRFFRKVVSTVIKDVYQCELVEARS